MNKEINVEWDWDNYEYYVLIPIDNQTLRFGIQLDAFLFTTNVSIPPAMKIMSL